MTDEPVRILIIDDEKNLRESLAEYLSLDGYACAGAASGAEGLTLLENAVFDAVVLDLRMPGMDGLETLSRIRETGPGLPVIMMSAHGEISDAVRAMKLGASDYLVKPFDPAELELRLAKCVADSRLLRKAVAGLRLATPEPGQGSWLGEDPAMKEVISLVHRVAPTQSTVLVTGESGTGKEVVARELHRLSPRASGPFVPINVGAIPETLLESELFGHEKGSFTGADARKQGLFELASGGTLFLDELGEMPPLTQVKLLRVLQEKTIQRVGGTRPIPIDVRIVAATNRDLEALVREGRFREDLFFRVNVIRLRIPPLRERKRDIAPLAALFLSRFAREMGKPVSGLSAEALALLRDYPFPGNVRELENCVERAVILCEGDTINARDLALDARVSIGAADAADAAGAPLSVHEAERRAVVAALERNAGHRVRTAAELGISRRTLFNKMKEYGLID
jgi:two-component system, NtrC family, response regulator AtoC